MDIASQPDAADLARWDGSIGDVLAFADSVANHPQFELAARTLAGNMLALAAVDRALDGVFKDAGRYVAAMLAIYLDLCGGVTLPNLKAICVRSGYLSPGRARALLAYMLYLGYVELLPVTRRGMSARYLLTPQFVQSWRRHLLSALEAAEVIEPMIARVSGAFFRPEVADTYARLHCETLFEVSRDVQRRSAFVEVFMQRHAGTQLVHTMVLASPHGDFLAGHVDGFSLSATARRLGVSRVHIRRMLDDAQTRGLLHTDGALGAVRILDDGRGQFAFHYGVQIGRLLTCAARTLQAHPDIVERCASPGGG